MTTYGTPATRVSYLRRLCTEYAAYGVVITASLVLVAGAPALALGILAHVLDTLPLVTVTVGK